MQTTSATPKPTNQKKGGGLTALVIVFIVLLLFIVVGVTDKPSKSSPKTTFEAHITDHSALDPATLQFLATIKNTGKIAATPICTVSVDSPSHTYHGWDTFDTLDHKLQPGEQWGFRGTVTVTKEGAAYVTTGGISCE